MYTQQEASAAICRQRATEAACCIQIQLQRGRQLHTGERLTETCRNRSRDRYTYSLIERVREIHREAQIHRHTQTEAGRGREMHAYTEGETGTDSKRHQQLSVDIELQRLLAAERDSHREAGSCIQRERD